MPPKKQILLLTNRDSDNVGDQIIERCVISILHAVMDNLGFTRDDYQINSRAAGIITQKFLKSGNRADIASAEKSISEADLIVFGGAPLFNYRYQNFYRKTITTLELAEQYKVPVIFSSIGVEDFDGENPKCLQLKTALNLPCVRQITTRDNYEAVRKYVEGTDITAAQVADPAVFSDIVFRKPDLPTKSESLNKQTDRASRGRRTRRRLRKILGRLVHTRSASQSPSQALAPKSPAVVTQTGRQSATEQRQRCIGLVVTRRGIFKDNKIPFTAAKQHALWLDVIAKLTEKGYTYRLLTTGHYADEVFLSDFVRKNDIDLSKVRLPINRPEDLVSELRRCDGIIAYRLHASITSYALGIPSIGLTWNFKVPSFYESIGYSGRALSVEDWTASALVEAVENAMDEGVNRDTDFAMSVYSTLFSGVREVIRPDESNLVPFSFEELQTKLPPDPGTSFALYSERVNRKMRRTYENFIKG